MHISEGKGGELFGTNYILNSKTEESDLLLLIDYLCCISSYSDQCTVVLCRSQTSVPLLKKSGLEDISTFYW